MISSRSNPVALPAPVDGQGRQVALGQEVGRGGEGSVYALQGRKELVAKLYHAPLDRQHAAKLCSMVEQSASRLLQVAAWPVDTLHSRPGGPVVGLLMPRVSGFKAIHNLYGPKTRLAEYPQASWRFLVRTASNLARVFAVVHEHGHVIGDVNHGNVLVSSRAIATLIDCDSFQVQQGTRIYPCEVGVSTHQPPEFQHLPSFHGVVRTPNHDSFGLAVLIFQLLMMGRHPFSGRYLGSSEMPIERAIKEYRYAYGRTAPSRQMQPPPGAVPLTSLSPEVVSLFERAFSPEGSREGGRPAPGDWVQALDALYSQLKPCPRNANHSHLAALASCPWCALESGTGILLFTLAVAPRSQSQTHFDMVAVWADISSVSSPGPAPALPSPAGLMVQPSELSLSVGSRRRTRIGISILTAVVGILLGLLGSSLMGDLTYWGFALAGTSTSWILSGRRDPRETGIRKELEMAQTRWEQLAALWAAEAGDEGFKEKRRELERVRQQLESIPTKREERVKRLQEQIKDRQLRRFLGHYRIAAANLEGIGAGREASLSSYGIETAADVSYTRVVAIPGFGKVLASRLVSWRLKLERKFVFDPDKGLDPRDLATLEAEMEAALLSLEQTLSSGAAQLRSLAQAVQLRRQTLEPQIAQALKDLAQAEADCAVL